MVKKNSDNIYYTIHNHVLFYIFKASQMWCLFRFLPIIIGNLVDSESGHWHCFLKLWNIVQFCTAPVIKKDDLPYLRYLIQDHHALFKELYPLASIIPKMHFLIHVPDDIIRYRELRMLSIQ